MQMGERMEGKLIILKKQHHIISAMHEEGELVELNCETLEDTKILGNIYTGKVKNIVKNINAAFVEVSDGLLCYYSLTENKHHIFLNSKKNKEVHIGDELLIQISKDNIKTKAPVATCYINITGKYLVLTAGKCNLGISNKISELTTRQQLKDQISPYLSSQYGIIIRTNAMHASPLLIEKEAISLKNHFDTIIDIARYRTCFQLIDEAPPNYLTDIRDQNDHNLQSIITDDKMIHQTIADYLAIYQPEDQNKLVFYDDKAISLSSLYRLDQRMEEASKERVWLKSGAYLIIQPTEAMVVIDVNTGKALNKKKTREHFLSINLEAAKAIGKQLRLRNLSGIIIIDFIDMEAEEDRQRLMVEFDSILKRDRIKTTLVGISKLNLVELTRKKTKKPLHEQIGTICPMCRGARVLFEEI